MRSCRDAEVFETQRNLATETRSHRDIFVVAYSRLLICALAATILSSCASPTTPSTEKLAGTLTITPAVAALKTGDSQAFVARLVAANESRIVTATWASAP